MLGGAARQPCPCPMTEATAPCQETSCPHFSFRSACWETCVPRATLHQVLTICSLALGHVGQYKSTGPGEGQGSRPNPAPWRCPEAQAAGCAHCSSIPARPQLGTRCAGCGAVGCLRIPHRAPSSRRAAWQNGRRAVLTLGLHNSMPGTMCSGSNSKEERKLEVPRYL